MTPRISPLDRRSPPMQRQPIDHRSRTPSFGGSPTPSAGAREDDKAETKKNYGDWYRANHYHWPGPYMIDVGGHRVHAQSWWQLD